MKKKVLAVMLLLVLVATLVGCNQADRVSENISKEADNFNITRKLTVINQFSNTVDFQMTGKISIFEDGNQLEITVKEEDGKYKKHYVGRSQFTSYIIEDVTGSDVSADKYTLNFNPNMILPFDMKDRTEEH